VSFEHDPTVLYDWAREPGLPKPMLLDCDVRIDTRASDLVVKPASSARPLGEGLVG
jgi:hypothetical protein